MKIEINEWLLYLPGYVSFFWIFIYRWRHYSLGKLSKKQKAIVEKEKKKWVFHESCISVTQLSNSVHQRCFSVHYLSLRQHSITRWAPFLALTQGLGPPGPGFGYKPQHKIGIRTRVRAWTLDLVESRRKARVQRGFKSRIEKIAIENHNNRFDLELCV